MSRFQHRLLGGFLLAFLVARPTLSQTSRNIEEVGRIALPPGLPPGENPIGRASDLTSASDWAAAAPYGFAYVARFEEDPRRVDVYDVTDPTAPLGPICSTVEPLDAEVEDVLIESTFLYVAQQDDDLVVDGVQVHNLVNLSDPCAGMTSLGFIPGIVSAHDLFFYDHSSGTRLLLVATLRPSASRAVHLVNATNPAAPSIITTIPYPLYNPLGDPASAYCDPTVTPAFPPIPAPPGALACGPHDIYAQRVNGRDLLVIAGLIDGAYIFDITTLAAPARLAHFNYFWQTPDVDGDGLPECCDYFGDGLCDDTNFNGTVDDLDKLFVSNTHDARISPDGKYLWTADEKGCGGHVLTWSMADILQDANGDTILDGPCNDPNGCRADLGEIQPLGNFELATAMPYSVHQLRWYSDNYAFLPWYEEGVRVLGISDDPAATFTPAAYPLEVGFFDSLIPNTDSCIENGAAGAACAGAVRVSNSGFFGDWGVSWDDCYMYIADRGSPDNDEATTTGGTPGDLIVLRYTGGPTSPQPLRVRKDPDVAGGVIVSWGEVPFASLFNIYRGTIPKASTGGGMGTRPAGSEYDHTMITTSTCDVSAPERPIAAQFTPIGATCNDATDNDGDTLVDCADNTAGAEECSTDQSCQPVAYYYLITARSPCDPVADRESNYGQDSFGVSRPTAAPSAGCPACQTCPL